MAEGEEQVEVSRQPIPPLDEAQVQERSKLWEDIFAEWPANKVKLASIEERKANGKEDDQSLTYGEIDFVTVNNLITMLKNQHTRLYAGEGIFLDLGSGCGKACVAAALTHKFEKVIGIESVACLDEVAQKANEKYKEVILAGEPPPEKSEIQFIKGDFVADLAATLEPFAPQVAVCIAVATCFGDEQLNALGTLASKMSDNALFVTVSQELPDWIIGGEKKLSQERYRDQLKACLANRGTDPASVNVEQSPSDANSGGWRLVHVEKDVKMPVGGAQIDPASTKLFVFKKMPSLVVEQAQDAEAEPAEQS
jgi:hypothetical protein